MRSPIMATEHHQQALAALPGHRAAPGQPGHPGAHLCTLGPPVPPEFEAPATGGDDTKDRGVAGVFFQKDEAQALSLTRGFVPLLPCSARFLQGERRVRNFSYSTGCTISSTELAVFSTCVFSAARPVSFLSFLFSEERERGRERKVLKRSIHRFSSCLKKHPRVSGPIHGFSVDDFLSKTQCWRGFAGDRASIHASTERNAPLPPSERSHGR